MLHFIKFILIIIVYVISAIIAIPILIFRLAFIMSYIMMNDMFILARYENNEDDEEGNQDGINKNN
jgi:uncharacterized membrane protein